MTNNELVNLHAKVLSRLFEDAHTPLTEYLKIIAFSLLFALLNILLIADAKDTADSEHHATNILFQCPWSDSGLKARIVGSNAAGILQIFGNNQEQLFSYAPGFGLYPSDLFVLNDGNLATLWTTGLGSYCHLRVFAYSNAKVHMVLQTTSDSLQPEFVYQAEGHIMGEAIRDKNGKLHDRGGPFFQQRIIVPNVEWVLLDKPYLGFENRDKQPVTADIYTWDRKGGKYTVRHKVPWRKRLQML